MKTISLMSLQFRSGKTSAAVSLAYWASRKHKTALMDLCASGRATRWLDALWLDSPMPHACQVKGRDLDTTLAALEAAGYEYVILDTPSWVEWTALRGLVHSDLVMIPVHAGTGITPPLLQTFGLLAPHHPRHPGLAAVAFLMQSGSQRWVEDEVRAALPLHAERCGFEVLERGIPFRQMYAAHGQVPSDGWHYERLWNTVQDRLAGVPAASQDQPLRDRA